MGVEDEILEFLASRDEEQSPYSIAFAINRSYGYTRNVLSKMAKEGKVIRTRRGWYVHRDAIFLKPNLTMRPLKLHGLKIMTKRGQGHPAATFPTQGDILMGANYTLHRHRINHSLVYDEVWRGRKITVTYHPEHTLIVDLRCSDNPIGFNEFSGFIGWLEGRFPQIPLGAWQVLQAGFNWDIIGMRLDGIESVTMNYLQEVWYRLYNKGKDMLRVEVHTNIKIGLGEALDALKGALENLEREVDKKVM